MPRWPSFAAVIALSLALSSCRQAPSSAAGAPLPDSIAQATELKQRGASWSNAEVRAFYLSRVGAIGAANEAWKREGLSAEARARRAYQMRHDARLLSRAMMGSQAEVEALRRRDVEKYGTPDGPTFEWLVDRNKAKGLAGDAIFEAIVESAQQTSSAMNEVLSK